jgi:hypothetical protein
MIQLLGSFAVMLSDYVIRYCLLTLLNNNEGFIAVGLFVNQA